MLGSGFFAVIRDVTKLAASAADDIASLSSKAAVKTAGIVGDDLATGVIQVTGVSPARELKVIGKIAAASFGNKIWLSAALLALSVYAPWAINALLITGALYLAYEGVEGLLEQFHPKTMDSEFAVLDESQKIKGAILTDMILSLEILVISLASIPAEYELIHRIGVLGVMSVLMTMVVYGVIALIVRLDDIGLKLARSESERAARVGKWIAIAAPKLLSFLHPVGIFAMVMVAGGIFTHIVHVQLPGGVVVALLADLIVGGVVGAALVAAHMGISLLVRRFKASRQKTEIVA